MRDPFHSGEKLVQERAGERELALRNGAVLGDAIPSRAVPFLAQQRLLAIGTVDERGAPHATVLLGARGFVTSADGRAVTIDRARLYSSAADPVWCNLQEAAPVGLLAIELGTRRRLRVNGLVRAVDDAHVEIGVREAYPNCPKYIQRRHAYEDLGRHPDAAPLPERGVRLDDVRADVVQQADALFVASRHATRGADVSHRGGAPGFVRVLDEATLRIPDYRGNSMFNTLGNFALDARAGLVFLDFARRRLLQLTGSAVLHFDVAEDLRQPTGGTGRYWDFEVAAWLELPIVAPLVWELLDYSPYNPSGIG